MLTGLATKTQCDEACTNKIQPEHYGLESGVARAWTFGAAAAGGSSRHPGRQAQPRCVWSGTRHEHRRGVSRRGASAKHATPRGWWFLVAPRTGRPPPHASSAPRGASGATAVGHRCTHAITHAVAVGLALGAARGARRGQQGPLFGGRRDARGTAWHTLQGLWPGSGGIADRRSAVV